MSFAELTGAATYIVHLSCKEALERAIAARQRGVRVSVETFDPISHARQNLRREAENGGREIRHVAAAARQKQPAGFVERPARRAGSNRRDRPCPSISRRRKKWVEMISQKFQRHSVARRPHQRALHLRRENGKIDLHTFVNCASTQARRRSICFRAKARFNLARTPTSSFLNPNYRGKISAKTHHINVDYSVFEGWKIEGRPSVVTCAASRGARWEIRRQNWARKILQRKPSHF